jgi:hypothetical protein
MRFLCVKSEPAPARTAPQREQANYIYSMILRGGREQNFNSWRRDLFERLTRHSPSFIDPENSFSCPLKSATESYPELAISTRHPHTWFLWRPIILLSTHLLLNLLIGPPPFGFPTNVYRPVPFPSVCMQHVIFALVPPGNICTT